MELGMVNKLKAAQVVAYLVSKDPTKTLDVLKLIKLVYLSDRESISLFGAPILMEQRKSLDNGPVNSDTYDLIKGDGRHSAEWRNLLYTVGRYEAKYPYVELVRPINVDDLEELSEADIEAMDAVWDAHGGVSAKELANWTHDHIPEWENPHGSSKPINLETIMENVGINDAHARAQELISLEYSMEALREKSA